MRNIIVAFALAGLIEGAAFAQNLTAGRGIYVKECQTCHAASGRGNAAMAKAKMLDIKPITTDEVMKKSNADLKKIITDGQKQMEPIKGLSEADLDNVVAYIRTLKK